MSFSARDAIAFLQQFVEDGNSPRFYLIPETSPTATTEAVSFMKSCWSSDVRMSSEYPTNNMRNSNGSNNNKTTGVGTSLAALGSCGTCSLPDVSPRNASVVYCETPTVVEPLTPSRNLDDREGFFSTAVIPVHPEMSNRYDRNGVA
ncbi:hypothetical protein LSM04_000809 [Trypanosoma melophagium]|uniref:uncharacterized protein n=1 Tax=Trypanosoma melophagium TaxID=715481 RepID=UPI00351A0311|nr:hypothetical protein LSM04_000809 [Trypanosoma melophagium]